MGRLKAGTMFLLPTGQYIEEIATKGPFFGLALALLLDTIIYIVHRLQQAPDL